MPNLQPGKLIRVLCSEQDRYGERPLHEAIVQMCLDQQIGGATVLRGIEGYGESAEIHRHRILSHDQPIIVTIVDVPEAIDRLLPKLEEILDTGLIAVSNVSMLRVRKSS
jgi:PII-like signaling protein